MLGRRTDRARREVSVEVCQVWEVVEEGLSGGGGTSASETVDKKFHAESKKDATARRIIATSCSKGPSIHILASKTAKDMWEALHEVYEIQDELSILALNEKFLSAKNELSEIMSEYVARVQEMARKLTVHLNPVPEPTLMAVILRGLGSKYRNFTTICESTPRNERTMKNLKTRLMIEEDRVEEFVAEEKGTGFALMSKKKACKGNNTDFKRKIM